jgi:hypothetical protein
MEKKKKSNAFNDKDEGFFEESKDEQDFDLEADSEPYGEE